MSHLFDSHGAVGSGWSQPEPLLPESRISLPANLIRRKMPQWPRISESEVVRHFTWLSTRNFGIDTGFYPLGSCTMKHNPRVNETIADISGIAEIHPMQPEHHIQGLLAIFSEMQKMLSICAGMDEVTLQPVAGAQGEFAAIRCIQEYHRARGDEIRDKVIVPDSAHGTNPASAVMAGYQIIEVPSGPGGFLDLEVLRSVVGDDTAAMMITNPNTLGIFEPEIAEASEIVHAAGGQMYYDGANFNAILGKTNPGLMGFDAVHYNLHKTFAQPHGGGGPGSGPIGVKSHLAEFLPGPIVKRRPLVDGDITEASDEWWFSWYEPKNSIGKVHQWHGNAGAVIRSWAYYRRYGRTLKQMSEHAVLNSNYLRHRIHQLASEAGIGSMIVDGSSAKFVKHEFTLSLSPLKEATGISALDIAKGLLDYGYMAPTIYFPLVVPECMMVEPTETESKETLDKFAENFVKVLQESPEVLHAAPITTPVGRVDEVHAARNLTLRHPME
ncbi:MAG: aminomethyl-transferring glycine dehydrogenase subunit GcvPB [Euryarchaeota archaeon]|jgi:glycine dehydrogenase subunit 2|nr:aminomethyl-transferring glycine dehydrogenase subunit GcvPB [Euryarchaeota archaeon]MBT3970770.1 aminomethyl-transferring glycine dehydrogenase subunit GcvPB [Euryarchaeota archaeon]MBT6644906.1 aminomethyl-transferring glycine dehydrogenase subunit GcvPB [Euryarchaeota archaeon]